MSKHRVASGRPNAAQRTVVENRRALVLEYLEKGYKTSAIAAKLGIAQLTVQRDAKEVRQRRIIDAIYLDDQMAQREIALLRQVQHEAWEAFERSREDDVTTEQEANSRGRLVPSKRKVRGQAGDAAFLNVIINAEAKICEIQGLIGKDKFEGAAEQQTPQFVRVVLESREQVGQYESLKLEQAKALGIIEGVATPSAGQRE